MYQVTTTANGKTMVSLQSEQNILNIAELGVIIDRIETIDGVVVDFYDLPSMANHSDY